MKMIPLKNKTLLFDFLATNMCFSGTVKFIGDTRQSAIGPFVQVKFSSSFTTSAVLPSIMAHNLSFLLDPHVIIRSL